MSAAYLQTSSRQPTRADRTNGQRRRTFFYGWWVVLACAVGLFWGPPVSVFSFPVFLKPLMQDFHVGRAAVSLGFTLHLVASAVSAPVLGWLIDRFYFRCIAIGLVASGGGPIAYGNVITLWFDRQRGLALGLMMIGIGVGAIIMPSFAQYLIARFGWRMAYAILGGAVLLVTLPVVATVLKEKPQDLGLLPDGAQLRQSLALSQASV